MDALWGKLVGAVAAAVLTGLAYAALGRLFPPPADEAPVPPERVPALQRALLWYTGGVLLLGFGAVVPVGLGLRAIAQACAAPGADWVIVPSWVFFGVPALFGGLLSGGGLVDAYARWRLGEDYAYLERMTNANQGYDARRLAVPLIIGVVALSLGLTALLAHWTVRICPAAIERTVPFGPQPEPIPYSALRRVAIYAGPPRGKHESGGVPQVVLEWQGPSGALLRWSSRDLLNGMDQSTIDALAAEAARRSGLAVARRPLAELPD